MVTKKTKETKLALTLPTTSTISLDYMHVLIVMILVVRWRGSGIDWQTHLHKETGRLRSFDISPQILQILFASSISNVLTFSTVFWGVNSSTQDKNTLDKIIKKAESVIGKRHDKFDVVICAFGD